MLNVRSFAVLIGFLTCGGRCCAETLGLELCETLPELRELCRVRMVCSVLLAGEAAVKGQVLNHTQYGCGCGRRYALHSIRR